MKKILLFALTLIGFGLCYTSCSSDYAPNPDSNKSRNPFQGTLTAKVYGVDMIVQEKYIEDVTENDVRSISIVGVSYSKERDPKKYNTISFSIPYYSGLRTYYMDDGVSGSFNVVDSNGVISYNTFSGDTISKIIMKKDGNIIEGTFAFAVLPEGNNRDTLYISEGFFSIPKD